MQTYQYKVIHVHAVGVYVVFKKRVQLGSEGYWLHVQDCVHDDFGNLVEVL